MSTIAFDQFALTRIADFARSLSRLHQASRHRMVDDDQIDREFNAVCLSVWGYTTDDFSDDLFSDADHAWLDTPDEAHARIFAAEQGYDLIDDNGMLTDWWGYCWMILAEKRGLLTPENRAAARAAVEDKYLAAPNVIGVIVGRCDELPRHSGGRAFARTRKPEVCATGWIPGSLAKGRGAPRNDEDHSARAVLRTRFAR